MKRKIIFAIALIGVFCSSYGQLEEKIKRENVVPGVIFKNGGKVEGFFKEVGKFSRQASSREWNHYVAPWEFQSTMKFIPKDVFINNAKIKNKYFEKYTPKTCTGYHYDTLVYETRKYSDMSAVGMGMIPKKIFLRKISDGKITIYHHFEKMPKPYGGVDFKEIYKDCSTAHIVYQIGKNGKLKLLEALNIEKELSKCDFVMKKYKQGAYGDVDAKTKTGKLLDNVLRDESLKMQAIIDYNQHM